MPPAVNTLYYGDNLDVLQRYVADESVDLVYLDPPFKTPGLQHPVCREERGEVSSADQRCSKTRGAGTKLPLLSRRKR